MRINEKYIGQNPGKYAFIKNMKPILALSKVLAKYAPNCFATPKQKLQFKSFWL